MQRRQSEKLWQKAITLFPGGVNSPVRAFRAVGGTPIFMVRGKGCFMYDADGNRYLDFLSAWGPLILGHAHPRVVRAAKKALRLGATFGTSNLAEVELAEFIRARLSFVERIRFVNSGTEAVMTTLRLARAITQRPLVVKFEGCYHGHSDALLARAGSGLLTLSGNIAEASSPGVPQDIVRNTLVLPLDDSAILQETFAKYGESIACAIIEPVPANSGLLLQRREFLSELLSLCRRVGALAIFDEVISGFRLSFGGYAGREGLFPDLLTYGKIVGGGLPVGAVAGRAEFLDRLAPQGPVYQAGTLSGNPLAMATGLATLKELDRENGALYRYLQKLAQILQEGFRQEITPLFAGREWVMSLVQEASLFWFSFHRHGESIPVRRIDRVADFSAAIYRRIFHQLLDSGIYLAPSAFEVGFLNTAMATRHIVFLIDRLKKAIAALPTRLQDFA
ncbi:MAG: glutamate-1-semialdehyde 2,1-aminomutase [Leptospiraceae bacterium]|nr:glutamate-1-semialdehyde 2,1-aminomutase [Leptospiraceae bacterium]